MLENIKSEDTIQIIFSYLGGIQKLKITKFNKNLQKKINININNYIRYRGSYIYELYGIGKEYDSDDNDLIYSGEYLNGKKNGKGKEYDYNGQLRFEGEYLNGKKNGKGKEYDYNGQLRFEGEYLNGKKNGKGKEYDWRGRLVFEGEYSKGKRLK